MPGVFMNYYPQPRPMVVRRIPSGREGIKRTLQCMSVMTRAFKKDPGVRELASKLVREVIAAAVVLVPRDWVSPHVTVLG